MLLWLALVVAAAPAEDSTTRLARERAELSAALLAKCPAKRAAIEALVGAAPDQRVELLRSLRPCGAKREGYFIALGNALNLLGSWSEAEAAFHTALGLRVTESAQLGLLTALVRQTTLSPTQQSHLDSNLAYFRQHPCTRDDLCAGLSYVAWHVEDRELVKASSERAITMGYPGWQPYFTAGTVYAGGTERTRAVALLREAKNRGGPAKPIDEFLALLGVDAGR